MSQPMQVEVASAVITSDTRVLPKIPRSLQTGSKKETNFCGCRGIQGQETHFPFAQMEAEILAKGVTRTLIFTHTSLPMYFPVGRRVSRGPAPGLQPPSAQVAQNTASDRLPLAAWTKSHLKLTFRRLKFCQLNPFVGKAANGEVVFGSWSEGKGKVGTNLADCRAGQGCWGASHPLALGS